MQEDTGKSEDAYTASVEDLQETKNSDTDNFSRANAQHGEGEPSEHEKPSAADEQGSKSRAEDSMGYQESVEELNADDGPRDGDSLRDTNSSASMWKRTENPSGAERHNLKPSPSRSSMIPVEVSF